MEDADDAKPIKNASSGLPQNKSPSTSIPTLPASKKWTGESMAEWRERGYVPDSDEEEDDVEKSSSGLQEGSRDEVPSLTEFTDPVAHVSHVSQAHLEAAPQGKQVGLGLTDQVNRHGLGQEIREGQDCVEAARCLSPGRVPPVRWSDDPECLTKAFTPPCPVQVGPSQSRQNLDGFEVVSSQHHGILSPDEREALKKVNELPPQQEHESLLPALALDQEEAESNDDVHHMGVDDSLPSGPVAEELQATLKLGLRQVDEFFRSPERRHRGSQNDSQSSSPLSSLGSLDYELGDNDAVEGPLTWTSPIQPSEPSGPGMELSAEILAPRRTLRQRTQIQLHPYALEDARYQQELKARGLKPVRIAAVQGQQSRTLPHPAGGEASFLSSSPPFEDSAPTSGASRTQDDTSFDEWPGHDVEPNRRDLPTQSNDDDDDLPDLASIFRDDGTGTKKMKTKRFRALTAGFVADERENGLGVLSLPEDEELTYERSSEPPTFFVPPSPPRSGSASTSDMIPDAVTKEVPNYTPGRLPTPLLSSETRSRKRPVVELSDSSPDLSDDGASTDSACTSEEEDEKVGRIRALKRRIKGVLPASWLKLDLKQQTVRDGHHRDPQIANGLIGSKGIAKPVISPRPLTGVAVLTSNSRNGTPQLDFSEEDASSDEGLEVDRAHNHNTRADAPNYLERSTDVLEDNRIDTMQPTRKRRPDSVTKLRKKRQQKISDTWQNVREDSEQQHVSSQSHSTKKSRLHKATTTKRQRKFKSAPRLTVLDAPGFVKMSKQDQPQFLKVASRRAQQNARKATQDPLGKFLKLATDGDTRDINHSLQRWRDSHIQPHHLPQAIAPETGPATDRALLPLGTTNSLNTTHLENPASTTTTSTADKLEALKNSTNATVQRILFRKRGLPIHSLREAASIASNSRLPASLARLRIGIGSRKLLQNRAGLGSLQRTATQPRVAQVEHILSDQTTANLSHSPRVSTELSDQVVNPKSSTQLITSASKLDKQLATTRQQPREQKSGIPLVHRRGKGKAPQHTQSIILTEVHQLTSTADSIAALSNTKGSDKISEEAKTVTSVMATLNQEDSSGVASDGWSALWPHLQRWLEVYSDKPSIRTPSEKERAKEIFKVCRELVLRFGWPTALDDLIKKAAWLFSAFDMVDPFDSKINPYIGLPPFLNELNSTVGLALPEPGDSTFYVFLDMLAISLTQKSAEATKTTEELATNKRKKTELQSFVNRLYPNNGQLLSEHEEIRKIHLASLWNRCSLYLTLYCYTPEDCRPRLSHFWNLVDFEKSHMKACEAILTVWGVLACFHAKSKEATQYERLQEMGNWMQSMILAMVSKLVEARQQVDNEHPDNVFAQGFAEQVLYINHSNVKAFLYEALTTWTMAMEKCENQSSAVQLLNIGQLDILLESVMRIFDRDDWIFQHTLDVIDQYLHKYGTTNLMPGSSAHDVVLLIFQAIHKTLSRRLDADSNYGESDVCRIINRRLTYDWSIVASALVKVKERSWDDFLEPAGMYSWQRFTDVQRSTQYKTLFVSHIIRAEEDVYRDNKFWYLSYWLQAMLRPSHELVFEHELSNAVLKADQYEPVLMNLPLVLQGSSYGYRITLADLKHNRTTALGRMIEDIATASTTYDSQSVDPYALQPSEMADLLSLIMNTMRLTRSNLEQGSKELHEYELMVCELAEKMERYTSNIVPVQEWLTDTDALAFRYYNLKKRFGGLAPATGRIIVSKQEIFWFQNICQKAASQGTPDQISEVLHKVYAEASDVSEIEWYQPKMLAMMEQVFPAYLELALCHSGALMAAPLLRSLDSICQNIFMRAVNMGSEDHSQLLDALYSIILSARTAMRHSRVDRDVATIMLWHVYTEDDRSSFDAEPACTLVLAFKSVVRIARIAILQFHEVVRVAGLPRSELERIAGHTHYIFVFVRALWYCLVDGEEWHWSELCEADPHHLADDEAEKSKQFTAEALKKHMREDWAKDYYGTWWVTQGRHKVQVKKCGTPTNGLLDVELRDGVKEEMSNFMDMVMIGELEYY